MKQHWSPESEQRYQAMITEHMRKGVLSLSVLALLLFTAFAYLDYFAHSAHLAELWTIRFGAVLVYLLLFLCVIKGYFSPHPYVLALTMAAIAALSLTAMSLTMDGFASPYYAGINLVILALALALPADARRMSLAVSLIIGIYLFGILIPTGFTVDAPQALANNLYFLLATGFMAVAAAHIGENMRRQSFHRYLEKEKAEANLTRSRDLLRLELKSEQDNVELLAKEITERMAELEQALQQRDDFISLASHELKTPLAVLNMQNELAQRKLRKQGHLPAEEMHQLVENNDAQLQRLVHLVENMFDITRIEHGEMELKPRLVNLKQLVADMINRSLGKLDATGIQVTISGDGKLQGCWDPFRIEQVILNLLTNAIKYGAGKPIEISLRQHHDVARVSVRDGGIGIDKQNQERIFQRFDRAGASREFTGLGLGLYISQQIVEAHGGSIRVKSQPGMGSTFTVELPLTLEAAQVQCQTADRAAAPH